MRIKGLCGLIVVTWLLGSCAGPKVTGRVTDVFGKPIANAAVSIEGTSFSAKTNDDGSYEISFVPGQFKLHIKKKGYTSAALPFSVAQASHVPASDVVLYPRPTTPGLYLIGKRNLQRLDGGKLHRKSLANAGLPAEALWTLPTPGKMVAPERSPEFINLLPESVELVRISGASWTTLKRSNGTTPGLIETESNSVGGEKLEVMRSRLQDGQYAWVEVRRNLLGETVPTGKCWPFYFGEPVTGTMVTPEVLRSKSGSLILFPETEWGCAFFGAGHQGEMTSDLRVGDQITVAGELSPLPVPRGAPTAVRKDRPTLEIYPKWVIIRARK